MTLARRPHAPPAPAGCFAAPGPVAGSEHLATFGPLPGVRRPARPAWSGPGWSAAAGRASRPPASCAASRSAARGVVVGNAAEGEPVSDKDRTLLLAAPHLVLDGLVLAAARGRRQRRRTSSPRAPSGPAPARAGRGCAATGSASRSSRSRTASSSGEESALVNALNGRPGVPSDRSRAGLRARRARAARRWSTTSRRSRTWRCWPASAPDWFRSVGTADGARHVPGHRQRRRRRARASSRSPFGTPLGRLLRGGRRAAARRAGRAGRRLPRGLGARATPSASTRMSRASLAPHGASVGAGVVAVLGRDRCGLVESAARRDVPRGPGRRAVRARASTGCRGWPTR